jgi:DNA-binding MarR family transcriptional regulator
MSTEASAESLRPLQCGCATIRRASRAVTQFYDATLRPTGLRPTQFTLLLSLEMAGEIRQADLAELLAIDSTTLSRTLKLLENEAWIEGLPGEDRRERIFRLTPRGNEQLKQARGRWSEAQERLKDALGRTEWSRLLDSLNRATAAVKQISP